MEESEEGDLLGPHDQNGDRLQSQPRVSDSLPAPKSPTQVICPGLQRPSPRNADIPPGSETILYSSSQPRATGKTIGDFHLQESPQKDVV